MALEKVSFGNCIIFALALAEVTSWTIDLPEVRKFFFEKNARERNDEEYKYKNEDNPIYYNNIEGNSKHNTEHYEDGYENTAYAREYGYQSYMERKVNDIVYNGSIYLEGLRRSLENYTQEIEDCNRMNSTLFNNTTFENSTISSTSTTWRPPAEYPPSSDRIDQSLNNTYATRCGEVTRRSEHVRRLAQLAVWAARELQDVAYARKYKKDDEHTLSMAENELILKLAWFLDRLAQYTGFEPQPEDYLRTTEASTSTTTTPAPFSFVSASPEVERQMMECLKQNSSIPAVDRCRYPEPLPPMVQTLMEMNSNMTGIPLTPAASSSNQNQRVVPLSNSNDSEKYMELLIAADNKTPSFNTPSLTDYKSLTAVKSVRKRSAPFMVKPEVRSYPPNLKRASEIGSSSVKLAEREPAIHFLKYLIKHKVWQGANLNVDSKTSQQYEVDNHLTHKISKRAVDKKSKYVIPENPFQDLSKYLKHKPGVNYVKDDALLAKIKKTLEEMENKPPSKKLLQRLTKKFRVRRYIKYEKDVDLPRESVNPQGDISYYIKNKPGTNYNPDLLQALQVRVGLQQIFETGNIEVIRRYGANYNPANPSPFLAGIIKSQADFKK